MGTHKCVYNLDYVGIVHFSVYTNVQTLWILMRSGCMGVANLITLVLHQKLKCISNVRRAGGVFEQIAVQMGCAWVDKTYIYWWREGYKSFIGGVHQSIIDTLTDSQLEGFGSQSFSLLPRGKSEGHRLQHRLDRKTPAGLGWSWEKKREMEKERGGEKVWERDSQKVRSQRGQY